MTTAAAPMRYARTTLPPGTTVACQIIHCDAVASRDSVGAVDVRFKVRMPSGELAQFLLPWDLASPALSAHGVAQRDRMPVIGQSCFSNQRENVAIPLSVAHVHITLTEDDAGQRSVVILAAPVSRTFATPADELAEAIDVGVAAVKPVLTKYNLPLNARDAIELGRSVLEQKARRRP